jgi:hypothetical protein
MNGHTKDMHEMRFGRLKVIGISSRRGAKGQVYWRCECDCGRLLDVRGDNLRRGNSTQCSDCYNGCGHGSAFILEIGGDE